MMDTIKTFIVDDEKRNRDVMANLLKDFPEVEVIGQAPDVQTAYREISELKPNLVLLDIQMPKADGFALLKLFEEIPFEVIFVTSFDQYAISAIKFSALDYLLKPITFADLQQAIDKSVRVIRQKQSTHQQLEHLLLNLEEPKRTIAVHVGENVRFIAEKEIEYIEADARYCRIFLGDGQSFVLARPLKELDDYLADGGNFVRINKSSLLHVRQIFSYSKGDPCIIQMQSGKIFEASRRKKQEVLARLQAK